MDEIGRISKRLFGNAYRLSVAAVIAKADPGVVHATGIAEELGIRDNLVRPNLTQFEGAGLIERLPRLAGQQFQEFRRIESSFWELALELQSELRRRSPKKTSC